MKFWKYFSSASLIAASLIFALSLLQAHSYWLMRCFYAVNLSIGLPLCIGALILTTVTASLPLFTQARWQKAMGWSGIWLLTFLLSCFIVITSVLKGYDTITSAKFVDRQYFLVRIDRIDTYSYLLYDCGDRLGIVCRSSSVDIGLGFLLQPSALRLEYDVETRKVYIKANNRIIKPD